MKFTVDRKALVKMLQCVGKKHPTQTRRDKQVRLSACAARVFVETNQTTAGTEALVFEDGTCFLQQDIFLKVLKTYKTKPNVSPSKRTAAHSASFPPRCRSQNTPAPSPRRASSRSSHRSTSKPSWARLSRGAVLDRLEAMLGYTPENTRLLCPKCNARVQEERKYT
jgi:hypothetical protein